MEFLIRGYVDKITLEDVLRFALDNGVSLNSYEADVLLYYVKNYWRDLLYGNCDYIFLELRDKIGDKALEAEKVLSLYKKKYKNYL